MRLKVNGHGVQVEAYSPNGGWGSFPLLGIARPVRSVCRAIRNVRAARAWQSRGEIL